MTRTSIRYRLVTRLMIVLVAVAVLTNAGLYVYLRGELIEQYDAALQTQARAVAAVWRDGGANAGFADRIAAAFPNLRFGRPHGDFLSVARADGTVVAQLPPSAADALHRTGTAGPDRRRNVFDLQLPNGRPGRAVEIDVDAQHAAATDARRPHGGASLVFAEDSREMDTTLASFATWLFLIGGGLSATAIGLVLVVVRRALRPLAAFSEAVGRLNVDSLDYRFTSDGVADELLPVSTRLNELLHRLDEAFQRERRFTGNVAHELRTPLAELRAMVEVAMRWPPEPQELRRHHEQVLEVVQRMTALTRTLLTLVRSDGGRLQAGVSTVDLVQSARAAAASHERTAAVRGLGFRWTSPETLPVSTDDAMLSSLLDNLFGNAALYATPRSDIECDVVVDEAGRSAVLRLTNAVSDLTAEDLPRLEEPFWRKDPARSPSEHAGLGLALVRVYAAALRTDVRFQMADPGQLTVRFVLPLAAPEGVLPAG